MENLNAEQVKKTLECCIEGECENCPYDEETSCREYLLHEALALINSQEQKIKELTEENERLRAENAKYEAENHAQFDKWLKLEEATKRHHSELFEEAKIAVKDYTVQKYKSAIVEYYSQPKYQPTKEHPIKHTQIEHLFAVLDQIAKEMLEGYNGIQDK
jgi:type I site-specific restriction endonuclease